MYPPVEYQHPAPGLQPPAAPDLLGEPARGRVFLGPVTIILFCALVLTSLGLAILFSATAYMKEGLPAYYLAKQLMGVAGAITLGFVASVINIENLRPHAPLIGIGALVLLAIVLIPQIGISVNGSRRWLGFGPVRLQVSEIGKLALVFCLAHYIAINQTRLREFKHGFVYPFLIIAAPVALIAMETDLGTAALVTVIGLLFLFIAGTKLRYIMFIISVAVSGFAFLVLFMPNRLARFLAHPGLILGTILDFLGVNIKAGKQADTYQIDQALTAFASGGVDGVGLGQGRQQLSRMPEAQNDMIGAVIGEEFGLCGTLGVVALFGIIFGVGLYHLRRAPNMFQFLLAAGCLLVITLQAIGNLGVVTGLFPTKGMSLPFISAGLSNLLLMGTLVGILVNTQRTWPRPTLSRHKRLLREIVQT